MNRLDDMTVKGSGNPIVPRWLSSIIACWLSFASASCAPDPVLADDALLLRRSGKHIRLVSDAVSASQADDLVAAFDAAVPQWATFWNLDQDSLSDWAVDACLMRDQDRFRHAGLIPEVLPEFPFGYAIEDRIWIRDQPSDYYDRHLLLHEGVHALMIEAFDGIGPTWFAEGTAELLAVHQGAGAEVAVSRVPASDATSSHWGRLAIVQTRRDENAIPSLENVLRYPADVGGDVQAYCWSWAAVMMLSQYPQTRDELLIAAQRGRDTSPQFTAALFRRVQDRWPLIRARWTVMNLELDYGFDWSREAIDVSLADPRQEHGDLRRSIVADRGWQSAGVVFPADATIRINATGQATLNHAARPWISRSDGVTVRFKRGQPLGRLIAIVLPLDTTSAAGKADTIELPPIIAAGGQGVITTNAPSWVLLRVNDAVGDLADNEGGYDVQLEW